MNINNSKDYYQKENFIGINFPHLKESESSQLIQYKSSFTKYPHSLQSASRFWENIICGISRNITKGSLVTIEKDFHSRNLLNLGLVIKAKGKRASIIFPRKKTISTFSKTKLYKIPHHKKLSSWKNKLALKSEKLFLGFEASQYNLPKIST